MKGSRAHTLLVPELYNERHYNQTSKLAGFKLSAFTAMFATVL